MTSLYEIPTKKLFVSASVIKVCSSLLTLAFPGTGLTFWLFGLMVPMLAMAIYVYVGINRTDRTLTDDKFADSCYYLGFLFTVAAIVISLIDLGGAKVSIEALAWRFGVAMVSTVVGMAVRVYLVNFRVEADDAVRIVEDALISGVERFTNSLEIATERYKRFETEINTNTDQVLEHINQRLEKMTQDHSNRLTDHFAGLSRKAEQISGVALEQIANAGATVVSASNEAQKAITSVMSAFQEDMRNYQHAIKKNLEECTLPSDFFIKQLNPAVDALSEAVKKQSSILISSYDNVSKIAEEMTDSLSSMNRRALAAGKAIESLEQSAYESKELTESVKTLAHRITQVVEVISDSARTSPTQQSQSESFHLLNQSIASLSNNIDFQLKNIFELFNSSKAISQTDQKLIEHLSNISNQIKDAQNHLKQLLDSANRQFNESIAQLKEGSEQLQSNGTDIHQK